MRHVYPQLPAEKVLFRENFWSAAASVRNGVVTAGAPVWTCRHSGVKLDGALDRLTYDVGSAFHTTKISFRVEFTPSFDWDADDFFCFFAVPGWEYGCYKSDNGDNNRLCIFLGNTFITAVDGPNYSAHWKVDKRNVLEISSESGDTCAWLNGIQILPSCGTAWNPTAPSTLDIGHRGGSFPFAGQIHSVTIAKAVITPKEASDSADKRTFSFLNSGTVHLTMREQIVSAGAQCTPDKTRHGRHCWLGDGGTPATIPTFLGGKKGFSFDGVAQFGAIYGSCNIYNTPETTIFSCWNPDFPAVTPAGYRYLYDCDGKFCYYRAIHSPVGFHNSALLLGMGSDSWTVPVTSYGPYWRWASRNVLCVAGASGDNDVYLNGHHVDHDNTVWTPAEPNNIWIGCDNVHANFYRGIYHDFFVLPFKVTPVQARHVSHLMRTKGM